MDIAAEEVSPGRNGSRESIHYAAGTGNLVSFEDNLQGAPVGIQSKVMKDAGIHIVEVNGHLGARFHRNGAHVKRHILSGQVDGGRGAG